MGKVPSKTVGWITWEVVGTEGWRDTQRVRARESQLRWPQGDFEHKVAVV